MEDNLSLISQLFKGDWKKKEKKKKKKRKKKDSNVDGKASILIKQYVDNKEINF